MSLKRPAAGGESCKQDSFLCRQAPDTDDFICLIQTEDYFIEEEAGLKYKTNNVEELKN